MKKWGVVVFLSFLFAGVATKPVAAQCSICAKTSMQQGEQAGRGMNGGIVYLMMMPLAIMGFVGWRWWKREKQVED
ncbi:MAG: hypothetical protein ABIX01_09555 [Chitinophagaceae bacterium]